MRGSSNWPRAFYASLIFLAVSVLVLVAVAVASIGDDTGAQPNGDRVQSTAPADSPTVAEPSPPPPTAAGAFLPCGDILVPVGKQRALAASCAPNDLTRLPASMSYVVDTPIELRQEAAAAVRQLFEAARNEGLHLVVRSAYRSYEQQVRTFEANVRAFGLEYANRTSARAGHSEHQLGTAADVTSASNAYGLEGFERTAESRWLAANVVNYGFVISYPDGKEAITGYLYEPWHIRYVGREVAAAIAASGLTPIEFLSRR